MLDIRECDDNEDQLGAIHGEVDPSEVSLEMPYQLTELAAALERHGFFIAQTVSKRLEGRYKGMAELGLLLRRGEQHLYIHSLRSKERDLFELTLPYSTTEAARDELMRMISETRILRIGHYGGAGGKLEVSFKFDSGAQWSNHWIMEQIS